MTAAVPVSSTSSKTPNIEHLFNLQWLRSDGESKGPLSSWVFYAYAPIGLLMFIIRMGILLQFFVLKIVLPKSNFKRKALEIMGMIVGVSVSVDGDYNSDSTSTIVSNHITVMDHFVIHSITDGLHFREKTVIPWYLESLLGICTNPTDGEHVPIIYFPEQDSTNGSIGLLSFNDIQITHNTHQLVQPIALSVSRPFLNVNTLQSGSGMELFFTLFSINTHFNIRFLPVCRWDKVVVEGLIASSLNIQPSKFSRSDKAEYRKKVTFRPMSMTSMARLVQQQLHPIQLSPDSVIAALEKTGSVEGAVKELRRRIAEPSFAKNAAERMTSFQERKRLMIERAREKYLLKHGLLTPSSSSSTEGHQSKLNEGKE